MRIFWQQFDKFTDPHYYTDEELETSKAQPSKSYIVQ